VLCFYQKLTQSRYRRITGEKINYIQLNKLSLKIKSVTSSSLRTVFIGTYAMSNYRIRISVSYPNINFQYLGNNNRYLYQINKKKASQVSNVLLYCRSVLFMCIDIIVYQKRFWTEMICQPGIYFPVNSEKYDLCFNNLNTPELNHVQKMRI